jgi:hypothetical protein
MIFGVYIYLSKAKGYLINSAKELTNEWAKRHKVSCHIYGLSDMTNIELLPFEWAYLHMHVYPFIRTIYHLIHLCRVCDGITKVAKVLSLGWWQALKIKTLYYWDTRVWSQLMDGELNTKAMHGFSLKRPASLYNSIRVTRYIRSGSVCSSLRGASDRTVANCTMLHLNTIT